MNQKSWKGPVKVFCHRNRDVWIFVDGSLKKIADCRVQPHIIQREPDGNAQSERNTSDYEEDENSITSEHDNVSDDCTDENESKNDSVGGAMLRSSQSECFDDSLTTFIFKRY